MPACEYQRMNGARSRSLASAKHRTNCSTVAASPSWRWKYEIHAFAEQLRPDQGVKHPHHLGALFVDGRGVEVVDLAIELGPHRMGERAGVLGELVRAQAAHVVDAGYDARALVGGELLLAIDREPFLQAELKPVAAGDAVAGPVVEILVGDDGLDGFEVVVGRGLPARPARICR